MKNSKLITIIVALLSLVGIVLFIMTMGADEEDPIALSKAVSPLVTYSLILLILTAGVTVLASILSLFKNPEALKKSLLGLLAMGVLLVISYMLASDSQVLGATKEVVAEAGSSVSKYTSTGIWLSIILIVIAGGFFVWDLLKGIVKS
ncbi:hypothetical protein SAMN05444344_0819 [Tenacibaculum mesophilum]|uniref:Uncharacterized protein n=1 Tax=Tenacibaculum mesophilum TaxID=104268 RepID=A0AAE9MMI8_9FLAO|nr:hypothetical protein [Tenacibaculum mesophilum]KAF9659635.1 hypothetical protein HBA12_05170 [Tenacibaculum mesophilum]QFS28632.1 hypothetical protein F9Y86_09595 [Tenacibaculum mesophilum]UTD16087.1 hypothetical protein HER15_11655 [Tenacibaculum mesophilum]SHF61945.1 hypothetical protein SAMN05444344_0819 [Tenacibaculum mesophilum]